MKACCIVFPCSPYYYQLYINRANVYMEVKNYRYSVGLYLEHTPLLLMDFVHVGW